MPNHETRIRRNQPELADRERRIVEALAPVVERIAEHQRACPSCGGPSTRGGICWNCVSEPTAETPWGV